MYLKDGVILRQELTTPTTHVRVKAVKVSPWSLPETLIKGFKGGIAGTSAGASAPEPATFP